MQEVAAWLPVPEESATGHAVAAGNDVTITASGGGIAAGVIHGATVIGTLAYQRPPEANGMPVRLAPRPMVLAGREGLLAELAAGLAGRAGPSGPRLVALCGLGGVGKTSLAVEYAHRHLADVGICWQFTAEDPAGLAAEFAVLAAQLGVREIADARDSVASVHAVLARFAAEWLVIFDNAPDHPDTLDARHHLARWTGEAGDAAGARDQFAALLPIRDRVLGPGHPETLATGSSLAFWTDAGDHSQPAAVANNGAGSGQG